LTTKASAFAKATADRPRHEEIVNRGFANKIFATDFTDYTDSLGQLWRLCPNLCSMQASTEASSTVAGPFCNAPFGKPAKTVFY